MNYGSGTSYPPLTPPGRGIFNFVNELTVPVKVEKNEMRNNRSIGWIKKIIAY